MFPLSNVLTKCLPKNVRILCTLKQKLNDKQGAINTNFVPIYKFPYIRVCSIINRLKLYQTFLTITTIPGTKILSDMNIIENDIAIPSLVFGKYPVYYHCFYDFNNSKLNLSNIYLKLKIATKIRSIVVYY